MKLSPKNYVETIILLVTSNALIGQGVFHYPAGKPWIRSSIFYTIFLSIGFPILLHYTLSQALTYNYETVEEKLFFYMLYCQTFIVNCTAAVSWYHYKKAGRIVERITAIDETLRELGADCRYAHTFRYILGAIVGHIILVFTINIVDLIWFSNGMTTLEMLWFNIVSHHPFHISSFALLNFSMFVRTIITRFAITNEILETITNQGGMVNYPRTLSVWRKKSQVGPDDSSVAEENPSLRDDCQKYLVQIVKQVHLELCGISRDLNETYGVQIVLQFTQYLVLLTALIYDLYLNYVLTGQPRRETRISVLCVWLVIHFAKIVLVNYLCGKAVLEANRTSEIIHESNALYDEPEFKDEINQFALQMMQNPLSFTPAGFFTLNNKFVRTMLGTITTYAVILIEMNLVTKI